MLGSQEQVCQLQLPYSHPKVTTLVVLIPLCQVSPCLSLCPSALNCKFLDRLIHFEFPQKLGQQLVSLLNKWISYGYNRLRASKSSVGFHSPCSIQYPLAPASHGSPAGLVRNLCSIHPTVVTLLPFLSKILFICLFCRSFNLRWYLIQCGLVQRAVGKNDPRENRPLENWLSA